MIILGHMDAAPIIFDGLHKLEYLGYDSAGMAVCDQGQPHIRRCEGKLARNLAKSVTVE